MSQRDANRAAGIRIRELDAVNAQITRHRDEIAAENQRLREREETVRGNLYLYGVGELDAPDALEAIRFARGYKPGLTQYFLEAREKRYRPAPVDRYGTIKEWKGEA